MAAARTRVICIVSTPLRAATLRNAHPGLITPCHGLVVNRGYAAEVKMDQTKKSNDPSEENKDDHQAQAEMVDSDKGRDHPAKQADPQKAPSKSTGIQTEGPDSKAGEGEDKKVMEDSGAGPYMKQ